MIDIVLLYNRSNPYGLKKDAELISAALQKGRSDVSIFHCDPLEQPRQADVCIHLEQPVYMWQSWSTTNVLVVNPEWYKPSAYNAYLAKFDLVVFKNENARMRFVNELGPLLPLEKTVVIPWALGSWTVEGVQTNPQSSSGLGFATFLGASKNRHDFLLKFLPFWRPSYPQLNIFSALGIADLSGATLPQNIKIHVGDLDEKKRYRLATFFPGHVVCSASEGFSYTAAEAEAVGAYTIHNTIEAFSTTYNGCEGVAWFPTTEVATDSEYSLALFAKVNEEEEAQNALDRIISTFMKDDISTLRETRKAQAAARLPLFQTAWSSLLSKIPRPPKKSTLSKADTRANARPPILLPEDCPPISVVTLIYNRKKFFDLACHSMMIQDYPKEKIQWIIVDDSDDPAEQNSDHIARVAESAAPLTIKYVPLRKKMPVSEKRNIGTKYATATIVLMMDDDDHYPETSFRRRVAWLTLHPWLPRCVAGTTIACYDLVKAISAVNVPPLDIPLAERVSEATLTYYKTWWDEKHFPSDIQVGEGEGFLHGREGDVLELPPQQIIVAFSHGQNTSSRRVPEGEGVTPGCFWGFPKEFLVFIHGLAGLKVETT
jgi:hypothetical protein